MSNRLRHVVAAALAATTWVGAMPAASGAQPGSTAPRPTTPIEHLIVVMGENQSFDSLFATWRPEAGSTARNLLSEGIVQADGTPGANFARAVQQRAVPQAKYSLDPPRLGPYEHLPQPTLIGVTDADGRLLGDGPDARFPSDLLPGPFQITRYLRWPEGAQQNSLSAATGNLVAATGDPVHRFFQMWQQTGGNNTHPDLFAWVGETAGMGGDTQGVRRGHTGQGGEAMGFLNIAQGDAPVFADLARRYAISDNHHQSIMGGTGANFFALSTGDLPYFNIGGRAARPPANQIENPDPTEGTDNFYVRDGYSGGSYVNCSDEHEPGVAAIWSLLKRSAIAPRCAPGHYYLVNNYSPGYDLEGRLQPIAASNFNYPPQDVRTIAEGLGERHVSWAWYTGGRNAADVAEEVQRQSMTLAAARRLQYNDIGDPLVASRAVMNNAGLRSGLRGLASLNEALTNGRLPAVSFVVPKNLDSGHPGYSALPSFEAFVADIVRSVQADPKLWAHTALVITTDESGGHFDSGWIQSVDFFGDGPRVPLILVSPFARAGHVDHTYTDHASILKFIEKNWRLRPLSGRSRDNLPNPIASAGDPYRPSNGPAVGDLMSLFDFTRQ